MLNRQQTKNPYVLPICQVQDLRLVVIFIQLLIQMTPIVILYLLVSQITAEPISASLTLISYQPQIFQLNFSEPVSIPSFQLILNNAKLINYTLLTNDNHSNTYYFQADSYQQAKDQILQKYEVLFNSPLSIGNGRLSIQYFKINAQKAGIQIQQPSIWGYLLLISGYLLVGFGVFGMILIEFLQVYCLLNFRTELHTSMYHEISAGLFMFNPNISQTKTSQQYAQICVPSLIIILIGLLCFLYKKYVKDRQSLAKKIVYEVFVYDIFICIGLAFLMPSTFISICFFSRKNSWESQVSFTFDKIGIIFSYLGIITPIFLIYISIYHINPKINQTEQSWQKYLKSQQFQSFRRLHQILKKQKWYTRNKKILIMSKLVLIACLYFLPVNFQVAIFFLQFSNLFYVFMVQPYKEEIYMNIVTCCRLLMFIYYGIRVTGYLYFSLDKKMVNYSTVKSFLCSCDVIFLLICFCILIAISYQLYLKFSHLNYKIKLVREENQFKLKIVERRVTEQTHEKSKKKEKTQYQMSSINQEKQIYHIYSPERSKKGSTAQINVRRPTKIHQFRKKSILIDQMSYSYKLVQKQIEDNPNESRDKAKSVISSENREKSSKKDKARWKKQSLLAQILKER